MEKLLATLNPAQREAVTHVEGPLLVLAGAGTGKTRVLTFRVAHLLYRKMAYPHEILAITFTNKAAREMKERVERLISGSAREIWISTFHSFALRILRNDIEKLGFSRDFTVYDEEDQLQVIKECLKELNIDDKRFAPKAIAYHISSAKDKLISPRQYRDDADDLFKEKVAIIYNMYQEKLNKNNALDFDDLLYYAVRLFENYPRVLEYYQRRFKYILVDEYQDTSHAQYRLVNLLAQKHRNLCVVGDPDQSIYSWRGADITNILNFERDYPEAKVVILKENYRSTQKILDAANAVIAKNRMRKEKEIFSVKEPGHPVYFYPAVDEKDEAAFVALTIESLVKSGEYNYKDIALLYRTHALSRNFEEAFMQRGIPYVIFGGRRFYDRKEIKDIIAYLRIVANPYDKVSLKRIINEPKRGIGEASIAKIEAYADETGLPIGLLLLRDEALALVSGKTRKALKEFGEMLLWFRELKDRISVTKLTEEILERSSYLPALKAEDTMEARARIENLNEFLTVTQAFERESEDKSLEAFLATISLLTDADIEEGGENRVRMMTLHAAKGLEFPVVFLVGLEEGIFPHSRAIFSIDPQELEEERRLCYVGITRAQKRLYLTRAWRRTVYGRTDFNEPSRFLDEIPEELIESLLETVSGVNEAAKTLSPGREKQNWAFSPGDRVSHKKFGVGTVLEVKPKEGDVIIKVRFEGGEVKELLGSFAPLVKV
ncbi:DNA helicase PcrA [Carboxydothermus ferrireducens]|uniref:ATP-dependent DNA helicase n=1 Tax=Carboxydothermus ferrireducens DSM 11255 TaxID=1119529 RepID=A0ABX2R7Y7_9THEO|nr:DNA helicase PcrA [Carboxydothermus ferrireducens]NYE57005.1 DNA helicase-2/ATP-dependent DNA helicase PcrA [Carboxydothermus ferrireducens DSM 11255]